MGGHVPRILTIWVPRWPVQRRLVERPELRRVPVFVCRRERRGLMTVVSWAWAEPPSDRGRDGRRPRITPGMPLAEAMAVLAMTHGSRACHAAVVEPDDPVADRDALERLARWCRRFSPTVGLEQPSGDVAAECIQIDVTGTAGFFEGEWPLVRTAAWTLTARGLHARTAIADTPAASWAAAHYTDLVGVRGGVTEDRRSAWPRPRRQRFAVVPPGAQRLASGDDAVLAGLPAEALRLDAAALGLLREVGIETIGGLLRLSAKSIATRFPPLVARRLAEFSGSRAEPLAAPGGEELPQAAHAFDFPLAARDAIRAALDAVIEGLVAACVTPLAARGQGVLALQVRLERVNGLLFFESTPIVIDVGLFRASAAVRHLTDLVRLRLDRVRIAGEIGAVAVEVVAAGPVDCRQRSLFAVDQRADGAAEVGMLLDRLAGRLGRGAVFEPRPVADAQPEHAWIAAPPGSRSAVGGVAGGARERPARDRVRRDGAVASPQAAAGRRPIWMPPKPVRLEPLQAGLVAVAPDGPPVRFRLGDEVHDVAQSHGPERIETAWWRGATVRRDYFIVETRSGARFWVFRRLRDGVWFLHGVFA
jgi:protein ImuB